MITREYAIIIERAENNYGAYCPDMPGCVTTGATVEETIQLMREALQFHVDGMREDGLPVPEPTIVAAMVAVSVPQ